MPPVPPNRITLLNERRGRDTFHLEAHWSDDDGLVVEGHDVGPITALMNDRGDYEYRYAIRPELIPRLLELLGAAPGSNVITVLARWTGSRSSEFEALVKGLRSDFWSW